VTEPMPWAAVEWAANAARPITVRAFRTRSEAVAWVDAERIAGRNVWVEGLLRCLS
jgi:hypothetical protein